MATLSVSSEVQSTAAEYGIFWQLWPQFDFRAGERKPTGFEVELIGAHTLDRNHLDPACLTCRQVKSVLMDVADLLINAVFRQDQVTYDIDSHPNSILCMPALGNRPAVSVSIDVWWNDANGKMLETDLLNKIKTFLSNHGIHQR